MKPGLLLVVSGPAGVGKGTVVRQLTAARPDVVLSVSATTRQPRPGEEDGISYFFTEREEFIRMRDEGALLECAEYCGNFYGTPKARVQAAIAEGKAVILEIEVKGAMRVKALFPDTVLVFVLPPDTAELRRRLTGRGTETTDVIEKRLRRAQEEFHAMDSYDYLIINDTVEEAVSELGDIISAERLKVSRNIDTVKQFQELKE